MSAETKEDWRYYLFVFGGSVIGGVAGGLIGNARFSRHPDPDDLALLILRIVFHDLLDPTPFIVISTVLGMLFGTLLGTIPIIIRRFKRVHELSQAGSVQEKPKEL